MSMPMVPSPTGLQRENLTSVIVSGRLDIVSTSLMGVSRP